MGNAAKAALCCLVAQALFVLRYRLGAVYFGGQSVVALTAAGCLLAGGVLAAFRRDTLSGQLSLKSAALAAAAAALGVGLWTTLEVAGTGLTGANEAALVRHAVPLVVVAVLALVKWEAADRVRTAALAVGLGLVAALVAGPGVARGLIDQPQGLGLLLLAAAALAGFLGVGQKLVAASSVEFAVTAVLLAGGGLLTALTGAQTVVQAAKGSASSGVGLMAAVALAGGLALAYGLLLTALKSVKVSTVGASFLTAAPLSAAYVLATGGTLSSGAQVGAVGALVAYVVAVARDGK